MAITCLFDVELDVKNGKSCMQSSLLTHIFVNLKKIKDSKAVKNILCQRGVSSLLAWETTVGVSGKQIRLLQVLEKGNSAVNIQSEKDAAI